jgi:putative nucleotidyltransferase with HDIG domain
VLREANSVGSASRRVISTIKDAAIRIGGARVLSHCLASVLRSKLAAPLPGYGYGEHELWRHSVAAAIAAEELGLCASMSARGMEFTASLLHDIGKLVIGRSAPEDAMRSLWDGVIKNNLTCEQAEVAVFGFSHAAVGAEIIKAWGLPDEIEEAVRSHHACPLPAKPCADIVVIANIIAHTMGEGLGHEGMSLSVDETVSQRIGFKREEFERICARTAEKFSRTIALYT